MKRAMNGLRRYIRNWRGEWLAKAKLTDERALRVFILSIDRKIGLGGFAAGREQAADIMGRTYTVRKERMHGSTHEVD